MLEMFGLQKAEKVCQSIFRVILNTLVGLFRFLMASKILLDWGERGERRLLGFMAIIEMVALDKYNLLSCF